MLQEGHISVFKCLESEKGTTHECKRMVNASIGSNFLNKTTIVVKKIIEDLVASERNMDYGRTIPQKGIYQLNGQDKWLAIQQRTITKQMQ